MKKLRHLLRRSGSPSTAGSSRRPASDGTKRSSGGSRKRRLGGESLERRQLLAGDLGDLVEHHNYWNRYDVNDSLSITPSDALAVINQIRRDSLAANGESGVGRIGDGDDDQMFTDVNADGSTTPLDALMVLNALRRGEAMDELVELSLTARDLNDDEIMPDSSGQIVVQQNQDFFLEANTTDLRFGPERIGTFTFFADLLAGITTDPGTTQETFMTVPDNLEPVLFETQIFTAPPEFFVQSNVGIVTSVDVTNSETNETVNLDFSNLAGNAQGVLSGAIADLLDTDVSNLDVDGFDDDIIIRFVGDEFLEQDVPEFTIDVQTSDSSTFDYLNEEINIRDTNGDINSDAVQYNVNTISRTFDGGRRFILRGQEQGEFDPLQGLLEIGGVGPADSGGVPGAADNGQLIQPFDFFSIRVRFTDPTSNIEVKVLPSATNDESVLLYGREEAVEEDFILLDEDSILSFNVTPVDGNFQVQNGTLETVEDVATAPTFDLNNLVASGTADSFAFNGTSTLGTVDITNNTLTYTPTPDFFGSEDLVIEVTSGTQTLPATLTVNVEAVNDMPEANDDSGTGLSTPQGTDLNIPVSLLLANDNDGSDQENDMLTLTLDSMMTTQGGTLVRNGDTITYSPPAALNDATDTFTYTLSDNSGAANETDTATVTISVGAAIVAPEAGDITESTPEDTAVMIDVTSFLSGGIPDTVTIQTNGSIGNATISGNVITYTPTMDLNGTDSLVYSVENSAGSDTGTISLTVTAVNDPPTAVNDTLTTDENTDRMFTVSDLTANDSRGPADESGDVLSIIDFDATTVQGGSVTRVGDDFTYSPPTGYDGPDSFTYELSDGGTMTSTGTVNITVNDVLMPPTTEDITRSTPEGVAFTVDLMDLTDTGDPVTAFGFVSATTGVSGSVTGSTLTITPDAGFDGTATVVYDASNAAGTSTGTVTVNVTDVNQPPTATPIVESFSEQDAADTIDLVTVFSDPDGDTLTASNFMVLTGDGSGLSVAGNVLTVTPSAYGSLVSGQQAVITFEYQATDNITDPVTNTGTITINGFNDPPVANDDTANATTNVPVTIDVLGNDVAGEGELQDLSVTMASSGQGTVVINTDNTLTFTPATDFVGVATINYTIEDAQGATASASATVNVRQFVPSVIEGSIFQDSIDNLQAWLNGAPAEFDGIKQDDEPGYSSIPVRLTSPAADNALGEDIDIVVLSDLDGRYEFRNVPPGTFTVSVELPDSVMFNHSTTSTIVIDDTNDGDTFSGPVVSPVELDSTIRYLDIVSTSHLRQNSDLAATTNNGAQGATLIYGEDGMQEVLIAGEGFEGMEFAEVIRSNDGSRLLLTVVNSMGEVLAAEVASDSYVETEDGSAVRFFGGMEDFSFVDGDTDQFDDDFANYRNLIDQVLGSM
ncbi:MAG: Ig-like domain-containing protein [Planctomycetota bacterium]